MESSLQILQDKGVVGAKECAAQNLSAKDSARVLVTVNSPRKNPDFDALLRAVQQRGLRRRGDAELLLQVLPGDDAQLSSRAHAAYMATPRGAVIADLRRPQHWWTYALTGTAIVLALLSAVLRAVMLFMPLPGGPIVTFMRFVAPVAIWFTLKRVMLASTVALAVSGHRLACVAAGAAKSSSKTKKAIVWSGAAVATAAVVAGAILSLLWRTPLLFVVCCALAVSIVNAQLFLDMSIHNRTRTWWG